MDGANNLLPMFTQCGLIFLETKRHFQERKQSKEENTETEEAASIILSKYHSVT